MIRKFARPYAKAIIEVASTPRLATAVLEELQRFEEARKLASELAGIFANPAVAWDDKRAIAAAIGSRIGMSELSQKIIEVLIANHRVNDLDAIIAALREMVNEISGISVAEVRTAHELSDDQKSLLREALGRKVGRSIRLDIRRDTSLLAGFVAQVGSDVYDASVLGQIRKFRESLT